jgi:CPA2 family monovalent cation:H+ antiporter-2
VGCRDIIRETYDSSLRIGRSVLEATGISREKAEMLVEAFNQMDRRAMLEVADAYDPSIPPADNPAYVARIREIRGPWQDQLAAEMQEILKRQD